MNPTLDLSSIYRIFYNVQTVSVLNPDGLSWTNVEALREPTDTVMTDDNGNGTYSQRTVCTWVFFKTTVPDDLIPQINTRITDSNGTAWYVSDVQNRYFGNVFTLKTESRAGVGVEDQQIPQATSTSSTTVTPGTTTTCRPEGDINADILLGQQLRVCTETRALGWRSSNQQVASNQACVAEFVVDGPMSSLDFFADAGGVSNGTAVIYRNGVVYQPNFAGSTATFSFANPTVGDVWRYYVLNAEPMFYGATFIDVDAVAPVTTTSSTTGTTSSSTTTQTTTVTTTTTPIPYVTSNLQFYVDAYEPASYPGSGSTWYDLSGNGNDLTLTDPFSSVSWNASGWFSNTAPSTANRGYFRRASSTNMPTGNGASTVSAWFVMPNYAQPHFDLVCYGGGVGQACGTSNWLALWPVGVRQAFWFYNCFDYGVNTGVAPLAWCNVTATKDATGARKIYVNGQLLISEGTPNSVNIFGSQITVMWDNYENQPKFLGDFSIAMIYDRQLSDAEVLQNFNAFKDRYGL